MGKTTKPGCDSTGMFPRKHREMIQPLDLGQDERDYLLALVLNDLVSESKLPYSAFYERRVEYRLALMEKLKNREGAG